MSNNLLKGKRGIVFGALNDMSIAWKVAERAVEEGAIITLSNTPLAVRMGTTNELAEKLNAKLVLEKFEENPFLDKFYKDPARYAFHTQIHFLLSRYRQLLELRQEDLFH